MTNVLLNRDFKLSDGEWFQLAGHGEFPHAASGLFQVIDARACEAMAARFAEDAKGPNFAGLLLDFDHFSLDGGKRSEAAGWIIALEARDGVAGVGCQVSGEEPTPPCGHPSREGTFGNAGSGLWAKIRWSDVGEEAVKGGRYRFLSPVWALADCEDLGEGRVRPLRVVNAAVTNDPNLKGLMPLSNREGRNPLENLRVYRGACGSTEEREMKLVIEALLNRFGLAADTAEAVVLERLNGLPVPTALLELENRVQELQGKHDALAEALKAAQGELVNRDLEDCEGLISNEAREFWADQLLKNRAGALAALGDLARAREESGKRKEESPDGGTQSAAAAAGAGQARRPLHNRATVRAVPPASVGGTGGRSEEKAVKIRNRAHEIAKAEKVPFSTAFRRAEKEIAGE